MITIGGTSIKTPSEFSLGYLDLDRAERNANGEMIIDFIAQKRKIEMSWKLLTSAEAELIRSLAKNGSVRFVTVTYPQADGTIASGTFYASDFVLGMLDYRYSVPRYKDVKLSMIQK